MKIYHSFWEGGYTTIDASLYNMHKLSVLTALKNYGNITLITTEKGKKFLGDLPYTNIELFEDEIPIDYNRIWGMSKLFAYKQICKKNEPFLHIDYDVFLFKKLPSEIESGWVICQSIEDENLVSDYYEIPKFEKNCKNKHIYDLNIKYACNTGVFGGNHFKSIEFYLEQAFNLLFDEENKNYWLSNTIYDNYWIYTSMIEQFWLAQCLNFLKIKPTLLIHEFPCYERCEYLGYTHLMSFKKNDYIQDKIKNKIRQYESI
jgi:hypothetical protein